MHKGGKTWLTRATDGWPVEQDMELGTIDQSDEIIYFQGGALQKIRGLGTDSRLKNQAQTFP